MHCFRNAPRDFLRCFFAQPEALVATFSGLRKARYRIDYRFRLSGILENEE
jgi:hypothetical protein